MSSVKEMDPEDFDLTSYIAGKSTFPRFEHKVHLDQDAGVKLAGCKAEKKKIQSKLASAKKTQEAMVESSSLSLADEKYEDISEKILHLEKKEELLNEEIQSLQKRFKDNTLTFVFEIPTWREMSRVHREVLKENADKFGSGDEEDPEFTEKRGEYAFISQVEAFCVEVVLPNGEKKTGSPSRKSIETLLDSLIPTESARFMNAVTEGMNSTVDYSEQIDAGFPSGSSHQE